METTIALGLGGLGFYLLFRYYFGQTNIKVETKQRKTQKGSDVLNDDQYKVKGQWER